MTETEKPRAPVVEHVGVVDVALPADAALALFTAEGERAWAPGWDPRHVTPADGTPVEGGIWLTMDGDTEVIWHVQRFDREAGVAEYLRVMPGHRIAVITVRCEPNGAATRATVSYRITPLSEVGRAWLEQFDDAAYAAMMQEWQQRIAELLECSRPGTEGQVTCPAPA